MNAPVVDPPAAPDAPTMTAGAQAWSALCDALSQRARLDARIVELTGVVARSGTIEALEGVVLDTALNLVHRLPRADRAMQLTAADVLGDMPATARLFGDGSLSWGQVRGIVAEARRLSKADRAVLDGRIGASADLFAKLDPDDAVDAVRVAAAELRDRRAAEKSEDRVVRKNFLWGQPAMFGPGKVYGEFDNPSLAALLDGVDAASPPDDGRPLSQRRADGLVALALHRCPDGRTAGGDADEDCAECAAEHAAAAAAGAGVGDTDAAATDDAAVTDAVSGGAVGLTRHRRLDRAVPAFDVAVDLRQVSVNAAGQIQVNAPGCVPTLTARVVEALAADASVRVVLFDGGRPLTATRKIHARDIPSDVRFAVNVRDGGDRFPGSRRRIEHLHHVRTRRRGHHVDAIVGLARCSHRRVHRCGWAIRIDPDTAEATFTRGERSWTTLPKGTRLRRPPPADNDPPG